MAADINTDLELYADTLYIKMRNISWAVGHSDNSKMQALVTTILKYLSLTIHSILYSQILIVI